MDEKKLSQRGRTFTGVVMSTKMHKTAIVGWQKKIKINKYDRYSVKRKKIAVHIPEDIIVNVGDLVKVKETRPISKTKNFVICEKLGFKKEHIIKEESKDDANQSVHKKEEKVEE